MKLVAGTIPGIRPALRHQGLRERFELRRRLAAKVADADQAGAERQHKFGTAQPSDDQIVSVKANDIVSISTVE